jgi:hypothetical protein
MNAHRDAVPFENASVSSESGEWFGVFTEFCLPVASREVVDAEPFVFHGEGDDVLGIGEGSFVVLEDWVDFVERCKWWGLMGL